MHQLSNLHDPAVHTVPHGVPAEQLPDILLCRSEPDAEPEASTSGQHTPVNVRIGPAARVLLHEHGLSPSDIAPTGPNGIVTKGDVLQAVAGGSKPRQKQEPEVGSCRCLCLLPAYAAPLYGTMHIYDSQN